MNNKGTVAQFRKFFALTPASDVLKLFVPHKAEAIERILESIESLADFNAVGPASCGAFGVGADPCSNLRYEAIGGGFQLNDQDPFGDSNASGPAYVHYSGR